MKERFKIETIVEHGHTHYKVTDLLTGKVIHCDCNELNNTMYELMGV